MVNKCEMSESLSWDSEEEECKNMKRDSKELKEEESLSQNITFNSAAASYTTTQIPPSPTLHSLRSNDNFQSCAMKNRESPMQHIDSSASNGAPPVEVPNKLPVKLKTITVVAPEEVEEGTTWVNDECNYFLKNKKQVKVNMVLLGLRLTAFVFCIISFAVLAADKEGTRIMQRYSFPDSFDPFKEAKYSLSVNVIGFVYSGFQICGLIKYFITKKHTLNPVLRAYFNFAMDQIVTYLLMSASSSAATLANYWASMWGEYTFALMANASVAFSYIAFVAFALTSLVSGYIICKIKLVNPTLEVYSNTIPYPSTSTQAVCNN